MNEADTYLHKDPDSFETPRLDALANSMAAYKSAAIKMRGTEARVNDALIDLELLDEFTKEITRLLADQTFHELPGFKRKGERLDNLHHLTVGPWRGIFLVSRDGTSAAALVFSKRPHDFEQRLPELVRNYSARLKIDLPKDG